MSETFELKKEKRKGNKIPLKDRKMMRKRSSLLKKCVRTKCVKALMKYRSEIDEIERNLTNDFMTSKKKQEDKVIPMIKDKPTKFYSYARSLDRSHEEIVSMNNGEKIVTDEEEIANALATQYVKVFSTQNEK